MSSNNIEQIFFEKTNNIEYSILFSQWNFDKTLIANALKAMPIIFPHYSLHDESHSLSILKNITKLLGTDRISSLSCTDLWLILECAYCHDLGMLASSRRVNDVVISDEFISYLKKVQSDFFHPCHKYTDIFICDSEIKIKETIFNSELIDSIKFLLSDFVRARHADYSKNIVTDPRGEFSIDSPRSLIPERFFNIIANICKSHGESFEYVLDLPYEENGFGTDNCHPRFISCLIRLGDLLDIDNDRFSSPLLSTVSNLPSDTNLHYLKHKSIVHLLITNKVIEIEATCDNPDVATITKDWFDMIKDEISMQTIKWNLILPEEYDFSLPNIKSLDVNINGYETIDGLKENKFNIDTAKALEIIVGYNLYKDKYEALREIIQNAIDSSLIRIFLDYQHRNKTIEYKDDFFSDIANNYPITIKYKREESGDYLVEVTDKGIGLKEEHITYIVNAGSSSQNIKRNKIIEKMPEWFRPSGIFGIGFQSIFLLSDKVELYGRDFFEHKCVHLELYSPTSLKKGVIYSKNVKSNYDVGLTVKFTIKSDYVVKSNKKYPFEVGEQENPFNSIINKIQHYCKYSFVPIIIENLDNKTDSYVIKRPKFEFDDKELVEFAFHNEDVFEKNRFLASLSYRNSPVESCSIHVPFVYPIINIHEKDSKSLLTLDRKLFKDNNYVEEKIKNTIFNYLKQRDKTISNQNKSDVLFDLYSHYLKISSGSESLADCLENIKISLKDQYTGKPLTFKEIFSSDIKEFHFISNSSGFSVSISNNVVTVKANLIHVISSSFLVDIAMLIFKIASSKYNICICKRVFTNMFLSGAEFVFSDDESVLSQVELDVDSVTNQIKAASSPSYIYYIKGYDNIRIPSTQLDESISSSFNFGLKIEKIVCPVVFNGNNYHDLRSSSFFEYIARLNSKSIKDIESEYDRLFNEISNAGLLRSSF